MGGGASHDQAIAAPGCPGGRQRQRGEVATDPRLRATQERLLACAYGMAHPERDEVVPACVQHGVLDPVENLRLARLLPLRPGRPSP